MQRLPIFCFCFCCCLVAAALSQAPLAVHPDAQPNTHKPGVVDVPGLVPFIVERASDLPGIVLDETAAELVGTWQYSTHTPPYVGAGYLHDQKRNKGASSVSYTPEIPVAGDYEVRLSHCYNVRRSTNTLVFVHHADGVRSQRINQQEVPPHGKLFRSLGVFPFAKGRSGRIVISNHGSDGKYVIADAIQLLRVRRERTTDKPN